MFAVASRKLTTFRTEIAAKGLANCVLCRLTIAALYGVRLLFPFNYWHAANPAVCRPYKRFVANLVNQLEPRTVVEIGSGIGDIIAMVHAPVRWGIDPDAPALTAARLVHPFNGARWRQGDLSALNQIPERIDVLLAIGWVHHAAPEYLESLIRPHLGRIGFVIVDRFTDWADAPFKHDFAFLGTDIVKRATPPDDPCREYFIYRIS